MGAEVPAGPPDAPAAEDQLLQRALDRQRGALETASHSAAASSWLRPSLRSEQGTQQLLADLEARLAQDSWLAQLQREESQPSAPPLPGGGRHEVINKDWWQVTEADAAGSQVSARRKCPRPARSATVSC